MLSLSKIKVLIVDDSIMFRKALESGLSNDLNLEVVGTAVDPIDAMDKIKQLRPDVITMDVEMPKMNGIEFIKKLLPHHPIPVVVVSSLPINALDALQAGAVDFVRKPTIKGPLDLKNFISDLCVKIKVASHARVRITSPTLTEPANSVGMGTTAPSSSPSHTAGHSILSRPPALVPSLAAKNTVIAIGASTGGTEAILEVVRYLPANTPGIIVVQHMPPVFTNMYAQRLDRICNMSVKEAADKDRVEEGRILIAAGDAHMRLAKDVHGYYVKCAPGPKVSGHCPSVDVLFDSVAAVAKASSIGVILTGMGSDGANGITKMRRLGAYTIGQDKDTCVVYGMPMEAYKRGGITKQCPLDHIGAEIIRHLNALK